MWSEPTNVYRKELDDGLVLRTLKSVDDIEKLSTFHAGIHGPGVGPFVRNLLLNHPHMTPEDQVFVETDTGEIVSALCLIPWTWEVDGFPLKVGELGIVATAEAYRRRGLIRAQMDYFMARLNEQGYVLSIIQGIPFYYRQFGYDYALPLEGGHLIELRTIPEYKGTNTVVRRAGIDDVDELAAMYSETMSELCVTAQRDMDIWRYLMNLDDPADDMYHDTLICEDQDGNALGYIRIPHQHFHEELLINEAAIRQHEAASALLEHAKELTQERKKPGMRMSLPPSNYLVRYALSLGARFMGNYGWQIHVPDKARLLDAMRPALESRLSSTPFSNWSSPLEISFYRDAVTLEFEQGRITSVQSGRASENAGVKMPPDAFMPLAFGYRSLDETSAIYPDCQVGGEQKLLFETLFPKRESWVHEVY